MSEDNRLHRSVLHLARFVLEARTALSIGTGQADGVFDHPVVRDANGLPLIPGTSLAGVLRHLWGSGRADALFGFQQRDRGSASRLEVAACVMQDSRGRPVDGLLLGPQERRLREDPLLRDALATRDDPRFRDRVRIGHRGVAEHTGKFDRGLVCAGTRFSGELRLWSDRLDDPDWPALLGLLSDPRLAVGGATRAGLGGLDLTTLYTVSLDLGTDQGVTALGRLPPGIGDTDGLKKLDPPPKAPGAGAAERLSIRLEPRDFWRVGQGNESLGARSNKTPDLLPKVEPKIAWTPNGTGSAKPRMALLPGSSVKGALAHRVAFHWNALTGRFADTLSEKDLSEWDKSEHCAGVRSLFGYANDDRRQDGEAAGRAGYVRIEDAYLSVTPEQVQAMIHNSIDRFTGGVRNRMLFTEELIWKRPVTLSITLLPGFAAAEVDARRAFARALRDLCEGRLALGGGTTKGHGAFRGTPDEATERWLTTQEQGGQ